MTRKCTEGLVASVLKAIRAKCLDRCCYQQTEITKCTATACALFPFRSGKDPSPAKGVGFAKQHAYASDLTNADHGGGS